MKNIWDTQKGLEPLKLQIKFVIKLVEVFTISEKSQIIFEALRKV